ncbi:alpha/beta-hydrolase [Epithele typhae]|uniref:alpha/beta-hydrolase n=1 Tax=Epithele typhae TaxID=378194 RepID=UPI002007554A|nr:alpha/beta-hydrolase [Epithele typhae]KAH9941895.1 alpha/beta-hydrolase [Epithele typhae]
MAMCEHCITGVSHEGTPEGTFTRIGGIDCYVAAPPGEHDTTKILLFLPDALGVLSPNSQLLADSFARSGYRTVMVDYFAGDPVPSELAFTGRHEGFSLDAWHARQPTDLVLARTRAAAVVTAAHPTFLKAPEDLERYRALAEAPLLLNTCEVDPPFPPEAQKVADEILGGGKYAPGYERTYWPGCTHGFAVRGDLSNPDVKAGMEGAFKATLGFLKKYFV